MKMARHHPELLGNLSQSNMQSIMDLGYYLASPHREQNGCRMIFFKPGNNRCYTFVLP